MAAVGRVVDSSRADCERTGLVVACTLVGLAQACTEGAATVVEAWVAHPRAAVVAAAWVALPRAAVVAAVWVALPRVAVAVASR